MNEEPTYEELKTANRQLRQRIEWLEGVYHTHRDAGLQVKSRFLSNISHEIRTPMNAILGFTNLLNNNSLTIKEKEEYIQYISQNSQTLLNVMENIMDLTLMETDSLEVKREEVFVRDLFKEIYEYYNSKVARSMKYRVALLMSMPSDYEKVTVRADGYKLHRLLDNLVNTAVTNQEKGVIEMKMEILHEQIVRFTIINKNNELLAERAKMIFEKNGIADDWHNQLDATGLSYKLALVLTQAMGGAVNLVKVDEKRIGIRVELPVNRLGMLKKKNPGKELSKLMNQKGEMILPTCN